MDVCLAFRPRSASSKVADRRLSIGRQSSIAEIYPDLDVDLCSVACRQYCDVHFFPVHRAAQAVVLSVLAPVQGHPV